MVRIDRVVTRGGDGGMTSLGDGARIPKDSPRIEAIGAVDETNAAIGWLRAALIAPLATPLAADPPDLLEIDAMLSRIQNDLFDLGADLCVPGEGGDRLRLTEAPSLRLETEVETMNAGLPPLTSFILPGGTEPAARAHMARTIARRAERRLIAIAPRHDPAQPERQDDGSIVATAGPVPTAERAAPPPRHGPARPGHPERQDAPSIVAAAGLNPELLRYLNRLSDHLFVLSRVLNGRGAQDVPWQPGANR